VKESEKSERKKGCVNVSAWYDDDDGYGYYIMSSPPPPLLQKLPRLLRTLLLFLPRTLLLLPLLLLQWPTIGHDIHTLVPLVAFFIACRRLWSLLFVIILTLGGLPVGHTNTLTHTLSLSRLSAEAYVDTYIHTSRCMSALSV
jgi:hypothetical protein